VIRWATGKERENNSSYGKAAGVWTTEIAITTKMALGIKTCVERSEWYEAGDLNQLWGDSKQSRNRGDSCLGTLHIGAQTIGLDKCGLTA
jgi:hypothetical protein